MDRFDKQFWTMYGIVITLVIFGIIAILVVTSPGFRFATDQDLKGICETKLNFSEKSTVIERYGNDMVETRRYRAYDLCKARDGTVLSNNPAGYITIDEYASILLQR